MMGVNYYERATAVNGPQTPEFFRLFMIPGMGHCPGGNGASTFDIDSLSLLEQWRAVHPPCPQDPPAGRFEHAWPTTTRHLRVLEGAGLLSSLVDTDGLVELGEEIFHMPVRVGAPNYTGTLAEVVRNPRYSTAVGLLVAGLSAHQRQQIVRMHSASFRQVFERMRTWVQGNF